MNRKTEILHLVQTIPGITSLDIYDVLRIRWHEKTWIGRNVARGGFLATMFGPSLAAVHIWLNDLEEDGLVRGEWSGTYALTGKPQRRYLPNLIKNEFTREPRT